MRKYLRYLRIAFSATCLIACVLLIVLWVRSYWYVAVCAGPRIGRQIVTIGTIPGVCGVGIVPSYQPNTAPWTVLGEDADEWWSVCTTPYSRAWGFFDCSTGGISIPYWFAVLFAATLAAATWIKDIKWRFCLRTLLIATTLIAVVLGLIVWATR